MSTLPHLRVISGSQQGMVFPLVGRRVMLGREPEAGIVLLDTMVSRHHAAVTTRGVEAWIEDLGSTNGTHVNGERISEARRLSRGDEVRIGSTGLIFEPPARAEDTHAGNEAHLMPAVAVELPQAGETAHVTPEALAGRQLMTLLRWSERLREIADLQTLADELSRIAVEATAASRAVCLLHRVEETANLVPIASHSDGRTPDQHLPMSRALIRRAIGQRRALLSTSPDDGLAGAEEVRDMLGSVLCVPMIHQGTVWGALHLDTLPDAPALSEEDCALAANLGHQSSGAIAGIDLREKLRRREREDQELAIAREMQGRQLPQSLPELPTPWQWAVFSQTSRIVGGDYHDAWALADGRWALAVGDVSGKGVAAGMLMSSIRAHLRAEAGRVVENCGDVLALLNRWTCQEAPRHMFMSLIFGVVEPEAGRLCCANAGHPGPIWMRADGTVDQITGGGMVLGVQSDEEYEQEILQIEPGDMLVLFTDGVTDTFNTEGESFGDRGVRELLEALRGQSPETICHRLWEATRAFAGAREQEDDFTALAISPGPAPRRATPEVST